MSPPSSGPTTSTAANSRPSVGTDRTPLTRFTTATRPRPVWPIHSPSGMPTSAASSRVAAEYARCSAIRTGMPELPCQLSGFVSQVHRRFMPPPPSAARAWQPG